MKTSILFILGLVFSVPAFSQDVITETRKIDEFSRVFCCDFGARVDYARVTRTANPGSKIYMIYYGARKYEVTRRNRKGEEKTVLINPMRNEFLDFQRGFRKRAMFQKVDMTYIVLVNGGYRERMAVEMWVVPAGAEAPAPSPTVDEKTIRFRKGTPRNFVRICDGF